VTATASVSAPTFGRVTPILRIFDLVKADEFYLGFLGFGIDWDHRFDPGAPLYRQISRGDLILHLSEHHGDGSPGVHLRIAAHGVESLRGELLGRSYRFMRPGLERTPWNTLETEVIDPFGNRLCFWQPLDAGTGA
jgi:hypothetical protein